MSVKIKLGQSAIEFIILVGAVFFFFIIFLISLQIQRADQFAEQRNNQVKETASIVQDEINYAFSSRDGYERKFTLPENIEGIKYCINITDGGVYIKTSNSKNALSLPIPKNVTGSVGIGDNIIINKAGIVNITSSKPIPCN